MRHYLLTLLPLALSLACGPSSEAPVTVAVLVPNANYVFEPQPQQLLSIADISKLNGSVASFIGGARMTVNANDPQQNAAETMEEFKEAILKDEGGSVRAQFIEKDGVLWPADFHSWAMVTAYWNLEQAFLYFQGIYAGRDTTELLDLPVYYWLDTNLMKPSEKESNTDNAFYAGGGFRMMAVLPFKDFQTIPMSINLGVMAHEYAHFVFDARVAHASSFTAADGLPENLLSSLNEGLADFHAFGVTRRLGNGGMVNYIEWSLDGGRLGKEEAKARDFSSPTQCMFLDLRHALNNMDADSFKNKYAAHYQVGTLFAASFYQAAMKTGLFDTLAQSIINAYDDENPQNPGIRQLYLKSAQTISLESVADVFLGHITDTNLRRETCNQMLDHLQLDRGGLENCPSQSVRDTKCPPINSP